MQSASRGILDSIRRIVRHLRESSRAAEKRSGIGGAQLFVLQTLARERALSISELAALTLTHPSSVSVVAARLVEAGLATRRRAAADARRVELAATPKGRALLRRAPATVQERLIRAIAALPPRRRQQLADGLRDLVAAMGLADTPPAMFFHEGRP